MKGISLSLLGLLHICFLHTCEKKWFEFFPNGETNIPKMKIISVLPKERVSLVYVKDQFDNVFIVKQYRHFKPRYFLFMVMERLSSFVAQEMDFPYNIVRIIPDSLFFLGKNYQMLPATLHKKVSGVQIGKISKKGKFKNLYLRQRCGKVSFKDSGLTRQVISHLGKHPDLPIIVAHDTFMSDKGRHQANCIYDKKKNRFYAIDLEKCFLFNLPFIALEHIRDMRQKFLPEELKELKKYGQTIEKLIRAFPPHRITKLFDAFCKQVIPDEMLRAKKIKRYVDGYKKMIAESYQDSKRLVRFLKEICP